MEWDSETLNTVCSLGCLWLAGTWTLLIKVGLNLRGHQAKLQSPMYGRAFRPNFTEECQLCACLPVLSSSQQLGPWLSECSQWTVTRQESSMGYRQQELCWVFALDLLRWQEGVPGWPWTLSAMSFPRRYHSLKGRRCGSCWVPVGKGPWFASMATQKQKHEVTDLTRAVSFIPWVIATS